MPVAEEAITAVTCKNCETLFEGNFCPNCSQKAGTHRFTVKHFLHEFLHAFTHTDKGIFFLIKQMMVRPGKVAFEYNAGKRKKYFNPFSFMLIAMALNVFLTQKTDFYGAFINATEKFVKEISKLDTSKKTDTTDSTAQLEKARQQTPKMLENSKLLMAILYLPFLSLLTWIFFKNAGFNYAENLVLNTLIAGQTSLLFIVFCITPFVLYNPIIIFLPYLYMMGVWFYNLVAFRQFYRQRKWAIFWKGSVLQIIYYIFANQVGNAILDYL